MFEKNNFIWGGKWHSTLHFLYNHY
ncbi:hypothetical protein [Candidatus Tisiphia endosymbiont of Nedyus quadrimaculatus]